MRVGSEPIPWISDRSDLVRGRAGESCKTKNENDQSSGYGCLIPYDRPVNMTRFDTSYILEPLVVGRTLVRNPDGLLGGEFDITLWRAQASWSSVKVRPEHIPFYVGVRVVEEED